MKNKVEQQMYDEFDFMYHHKKLLEEKEEQRTKAEQEEKAAAELSKKAMEAAVLSEKEDKKDQKKAKAKKEKPKKEKKIHPKYAKPYKNDTKEQRKKPSFEKRKKIERQYKEEHKKVKEVREKEKRFAAEVSAGIKANITRFLIYMLISAGIATVILCCSFGVIRLIFGYKKNISHKNIAYQVGLVSDTVRVPYDTLIRDGVVYVCGNDIVTLCGFTVTGNGEEIKYISPDSGNDTVTFYNDSARATVNKNEIRLQAKTYEINGKLYIPMSFFTSYSTGLVCEYTPETDDERASIKVYKKMLNEYDHKITGTAASYEPVTFRIKEAVTLEKIDENVLADDIEDVTYKIDITPYFDAINPSNIYGYISVVNNEHRVKETRVYDDLTVIDADYVKEPISLRATAARALEAMMKEIRDVEDKTRFRIYSGYHTFEESVESDPELDESQLGLSVEAYYEPKNEFGETATYRWFVNNAYKYGFIIRYPKDKTSITNVGYRPWVLRYVGRYAATKMRDEKLCLEEFIEKYDLERSLEIKNR